MPTFGCDYVEFALNWEKFRFPSESTQVWFIYEESDPGARDIAGRCSAELIAEAKRNLEKYEVENLF